jgi:hypothetical protein
VIAVCLASCIGRCERPGRCRHFDHQLCILNDEQGSLIGVVVPNGDGSQRSFCTERDRVADEAAAGDR